MDEEGAPQVPVETDKILELQEAVFSPEAGFQSCKVSFSLKQVSVVPP